MGKKWGKNVKIRKMLIMIIAVSIYVMFLYNVLYTYVW